MTERAFRTIARAALDSSVCPALHEMYWAATEDNPDVVEVLRLVIELMEAMPQKAENVQARATLDLVYRRIVEQFCVRLIDQPPGWEYTDK